MVTDYETFTKQLSDFADSDARFGGLLIGRGPEVLNALKVSEDLPYIVLLSDEGKYSPAERAWYFKATVYVVGNYAAKLRSNSITPTSAVSQLMPLTVEAFGALVDIPSSLPQSKDVPFDSWQIATAHKYVMVSMTDTFKVTDCNTPSWR
tara:strand:+ start:4356 stop:4805 length:450 start_codon:yes stop_codon:yes gene_type:complete